MFNRKKIKELEYRVDSLTERGKKLSISLWETLEKLYALADALGYERQELPAKVTFVNAAWNGFGKKPTLSKEFVKCFTDAGFDWGGLWAKPDSMHFQLKRLI